MNERQVAYLERLGINLEDIEEDTQSGFLLLRTRKGRKVRRRYEDRINHNSLKYLIELYKRLVSNNLRPMTIDSGLLFKIVKCELEFSDKQTYEYVWALSAIDETHFLYRIMRGLSRH